MKTDVMYIQYKGHFNFNELVKAIFGWFGSEYYNFFETAHKYRPDEREIELYGDRKLNDYVKYRIDVFIRCLEVREVEIVSEGKKEKTEDGRVAVELYGTLQLDWMKRFGGNKFLQALQDFYHKFVIKKTIENVWEDHLYKKVKELHAHIRTTLGAEVI